MVCNEKKKREKSFESFSPPFHPMKVGPRAIDAHKPETVKAGLKPMKIIYE